MARVVHIIDPYIQDILCWYASRFVRGLPELEFRYIRKNPSRCTHSKSEMILSCGLHLIEYKGVEMTFYKNRVGDALGLHTYDNHVPDTVVHETLSVVCDSECQVNEICEEARRAREFTQVEKKFEIYRWWPKHNEWERDAIADKRTIESIVLGDNVLNEIVSDIDEFTCEDTNSWYADKCIPYKRGYLLHGPPGCGKTSSIVALTCRMGRNIYRMNLVEPGLCDSSLFSAVQNIPKESVLVFEDIDCLFGKTRDKDEPSLVTFSGLLNAIDGVLDYSRGLIFFFTTNYIERLDSALIRPGRIDVVYELSTCTDNQMKEMFRKFYPKSSESLCNAFVINLRSQQHSVTPAVLQHHFIVHRKSTDKQCATTILLPSHVKYLKDNTSVNLYS